MARVLLVDDSAALRESLQRALVQQPTSSFRPFSADPGWMRPAPKGRNWRTLGCDLLSFSRQPGRNLRVAVLGRRGHDVSALSRGDAALNLGPEVRFDVIVTDLLMPGTNGIELIHRLVARYPSVPILAMSGGGRVSALGQLDRARAGGASSTLAKPFGLRELLARIEQLPLSAGKRSGPNSSVSSTDASTPLAGNASAEGHPSPSAVTSTTLQARPFEPRPGNLRHS